MCTYNITVNDSLMEEIRPAFPNEEAVERWLQQQMNIILLEFASKQRSVAAKGCPLSQRLRGIATTPKDFDYKQELANRYEA